MVRLFKYDWELFFSCFSGLGQMYVADERFTESINQFGEGLAAFMCEAMLIFADKSN